MTFETYEEYLAHLKSCEISLEKLKGENWKDNLAKDLPDFEVLYPRMPNSKNARYAEWEIWFEKLFHLLESDVTLVGHSLGGIFLAKYLSENDFPKKISSLHLVAAPYGDKVLDESLVDFALSKNVEEIQDKVDKIFIYQSEDDPLVSLTHAENYNQDLPGAELIVFKDRGHFQQDHFPELVENIKNLN